MNLFIRLKKLMIISIASLMVLSLTAGEVTFQDIPTPEDIFGNAWFPLYMGAMWKWKMDDSDNDAELEWTIVGVKLVTDSDNMLDAVVAWQLQMNSISDALYFIEHDGFICAYERKKSVYTLTKILPILARSQQKWESGSDYYTITNIEDETLKAEYVSEDGTRYGYQIFGKGIGPVEFFDYVSSEYGSNAVKWTLLEHKSYSDVVVERYNTSTESEEIAMEEIDVMEDEYESEFVEVTTTVSTTTTTTLPWDEDTVVYIDEYEEPDEDYSMITEETSTWDNSTTTIEESSIDQTVNTVTSLKKNKTYIQVGSFNVFKYAGMLIDKLLGYNYTAVIFEDKDYTWKVLIEIDPEDEKIALAGIRRDIEAGAFVKQRVK